MANSLQDQLSTIVWSIWIPEIPIVDALFEKTLSDHPDWWCNRAPGSRLQPKKWRTYFIEFPYRDIQALNREWQQDSVGRFKKRRELSWLASTELLALYANRPGRLWKRVRQLESAPTLIQSIVETKLGDS